MSYLFKQKLNLSELVDFSSPTFRVLIYEPEEYLGALYQFHLQHDFLEVRHSAKIEDFKNHLIVFEPHLLIFNAESDKHFLPKQNLLQARPHLKIITTAFNFGHEEIKELMSLGVISHINRRFSRPKDVTALVHSLLLKN